MKRRSARIGHVRRRTVTVESLSRRTCNDIAHTNAVNIDPGLLLCVPRGIQSRNRACLRRHARPLSLVSRRAADTLLRSLTYRWPPFSDFTRRDNGDRFGGLPIAFIRNLRSVRQPIARSRSAITPISITVIAVPLESPLVSPPWSARGIKIASLRAFPGHSNPAWSFAHNVWLVRRLCL